VDVGFGMKLGEAFRSGIRKEDFDHFCVSLGSTYQFEEVSEYLYRHPDGALKIKFDEKEKKCLNASMRARFELLFFFQWSKD
jgi:hypothetical protein